MIFKIKKNREDSLSLPHAQVRNRLATLLQNLLHSKLLSNLPPAFSSSLFLSLHKTLLLFKKRFHFPTLQQKISPRENLGQPCLLLEKASLLASSTNSSFPSNPSPPRHPQPSDPSTQTPNQPIKADTVIIAAWTSIAAHPTAPSLLAVVEMILSS